MGKTTVHVTVHVTVTGNGIEAQLDADQPVIASVDLGSWAASLGPQAIAVPYYSGNVWYSQSLSAYVNGVGLAFYPSDEIDRNGGAIPLEDGRNAESAA